MASDQDTTIAVLKKRVKKFVDDRDWAKYHNPKDVAVSITIEAAELVEIFQWVKDSEQDKITQDSAKMQKLKDELADVMIYCVSLANVLDIDIGQAVLQKIAKNEGKYPVDRIKGNYRKYKELH
jgi:NTP pyrophosphatase (non-canonical NTP hydrolase)